jgi:hypothetical protein
MSQKEKLRAKLDDGTLQPFDNYDHMMMVLADAVLSTFILRGGKEVSNWRAIENLHHCH